MSGSISFDGSLNPVLPPSLILILSEIPKLFRKWNLLKMMIPGPRCRQTSLSASNLLERLIFHYHRALVVEVLSLLYRGSHTVSQKSV